VTSKGHRQLPYEKKRKKKTNSNSQLLAWRWGCCGEQRTAEITGEHQAGSSPWKPLQEASASISSGDSSHGNRSPGCAELVMTCACLRALIAASSAWYSRSQWWEVKQEDGGGAGREKQMPSEVSVLWESLGEGLRVP
jgi:hypothetical protein